MLLLLLLVVVMVTLVVRRRRRKTLHGPSSTAAVTPSAARCTSSRSTTSVSTISAACNGGSSSVLPSSLSGLSLAPAQRPTVISNNVGYIERDVDEPPPPYSSLSASPRQQPVSATSRTTGRSLPPTPSRRAAPAARDSLTEHIYDEPSTLLHEVAEREVGTCPRSSMSRVRLGTTALRPATLRCQSPVSVSRQRPRACGTHQPRRPAHHSSVLSHSGRQSASCTTSRSQPPFFISNFTTLPTDVDSGGVTSHGLTSPAMDAAGGGVLYDEPWDMHTAAIPLTAMSHHHHLSPQAAFLAQGQPCLSDWSGLDMVRGSALYSDAARQYVSDSHRRRQAADLSDSSSSPLVTDVPTYSRHCRDNRELLDLLSPTCV